MQIQTENSETEDTRSHKKSPHARGNFSKCGKLCDQTFYLEGAHLDLSRNKI